MYSFFATVGKGLENVLKTELLSGRIKAACAECIVGGVSFKGSIETAYRACLWSRTANRILLPLASGRTTCSDELYELAHSIAWESHLSPEGTLAVDCSNKDSFLRNSMFGAQKVKDACVDRLRSRSGTRPSVDSDKPDLRLNVHIHGDKTSISIDLSGDSLHRRGYRSMTSGGAAPLKENLAAGLLLMSDWDDVNSAEYQELVDPMCGSGTFLVEAALISAGIAPGLMRNHHGFQTWLRHDKSLWSDLVVEARTTMNRSTNRRISGSDLSADALKIASSSLIAAGVADMVLLEQKSFSNSRPLFPKGLFITNPPYGVRIGNKGTQLFDMHREIGDLLKHHFKGWDASILCGDSDAAKHVGLRTSARLICFNGPIECRLLKYKMY
eukprot:ANDGO_05321.mRNA.1 Ribosomal RNA large subunit methyltransferase K/L